MMSNKLLYLFLLMCIFVNGQDELSLSQVDISVSVGTGSNRFFEPDNFSGTTPLELPLEVNVGLSKNLELGAEWSITFFNDKTQNGTTQDIDTSKSKSIGNLLNYNGSIKYSVNNTYRSNSYLIAGGGFSDLNKRSWIGGRYNELYGEGYNWTVGGGLRYQLGNMYDDVFPWFFDFSLTYTRYNFQIMRFAVEDIVQPRTESKWNDLKFGSVDIAVRIGYRFRYKK